MWFFKSPEIVHGEEALNHLEQLEGKRAHIITDAVLVKLGHVDRVRKVLESAGFQVAVFDCVEPDPSLETVHAGAAELTKFGPDWIVALGGGSCIDAAKAMWILYERPDVDPEGINPIENFHLRRKARLVAIPPQAAPAPSRPDRCAHQSRRAAQTWPGDARRCPTLRSSILRSSWTCRRASPPPPAWTR
jgi:alcohol dehydrogenase class IV